MRRSLVLLPTFNERDNLEGVVAELARIEEPVDVLVIDDASPDDTGEAAEALRKDYPFLSVLHRQRREGLGRAYLEGIRRALNLGYARVVTVDADGSHRGCDVPRLLERLDGAGVAIGSRWVAGGAAEGLPPWRVFLSRAGSFYARRLLSLPVRDVTSGFRAYCASALESLDLDRLEAKGFAFRIEILALLHGQGAAMVEVPIRFRKRKGGRSKLDLRVVLEALWTVKKLRRRLSREAASGRSP